MSCSNALSCMLQCAVFNGKVVGALMALGVLQVDVVELELSPPLKSRVHCKLEATNP